MQSWSWYKLLVVGVVAEFLYFGLLFELLLKYKGYWNGLFYSGYVASFADSECLFASASWEFTVCICCIAFVKFFGLTDNDAQTEKTPFGGLFPPRFLAGNGWRFPFWKGYCVFIFLLSEQLRSCSLAMTFAIWLRSWTELHCFPIIKGRLSRVQYDQDPGQ